jgi:hypothetical protein
MSMIQITKSLFKQKFEDSLAIVETDYAEVHFRYFISKQYGLGIAVTYVFSPELVEREYYMFQVSEEIALKLRNAYVYITDISLRKKIINSEMISIFNDELGQELPTQEIQVYVHDVIGEK